ncbi:MAG: tRNA (N(6)-L-threonylcarbamoyladenosine(37)-C(2))-methylthiotransferase MtaB [Candidatus Melainabacteria bacterium]|nr:tRNA (N(6)-L-threonylcarbamoyladenosine(37)-C(2))-methylthiotransferase MtaB [Candidatus Melainabacteria bacterium]
MMSSRQTLSDESTHPAHPLPATSQGLASRRVAFCTLGCKANQLESSAMAQSFSALGWQVVSENESAHLYVFNTCTVTERADAEARRLIRKFRRQNPSAHIAVTGCYAQIAPEVIAGIDGVDFIIGNTHKEQLPELLQQHMVSLAEGVAANQKRVPVQLVEAFDFGKSRERAETNPMLAVGAAAGIDRARASLKIQDGCDYKCTYCIIWQARGPSRSVAKTTVLNEIRRLVAEGFTEVVLTGINIGQYQDGPCDLNQLLQAIAQLPGTFRVRLTSLDPLEVTEPLIETIATSGGRIAPHIHLSTQSADDAVLKRMARRHHQDHLIAVCQQLAACVPHVTLAADVIVGFPGETHTAFETTYQVLERLPMHLLHVFRYSPRPGTPAATMDGAVPDRIRKERAERLIALGEQKARYHRQQMIGTIRPTMIESQTEQGDWLGISDNYLRVLFPAQPTGNADDMAKAFKPQALVSAHIVAVDEAQNLLAQNPLIGQPI